jgi:NAD kinase
VEENNVPDLVEHDVKVYNKEQEENIDLIITIGGDGTIL